MLQEVSLASRKLTVGTQGLNRFRKRQTGRKGVGERDAALDLLMINYHITDLLKGQVLESTGSQPLYRLLCYPGPLIYVCDSQFSSHLMKMPQVPPQSTGMRDGRWDSWRALNSDDKLGYLVLYCELRAHPAPRHPEWKRAVGGCGPPSSLVPGVPPKPPSQLPWPSPQGCPRICPRCESCLLGLLILSP